MKTTEQSLSRLNSMLMNEEVPVEEIKNLLLLIIDLTAWQFKVIDFNLYNLQLLEQLKKSKEHALHLCEYEKAADFRDQEKYCMQYMEFIKHHQLEHSIFHFGAKTIYYCYYGNNERETEVLKMLQQITH